MPNDPSTYASEREIAELWSEIRRLREETEAQKTNGHEGNGKPKSDGKEDEEPSKQEPAAEKKSHPMRKVLIVAGVILLVVVAVVWWLHARQYEGTDDAEVDGHLSGVSARISGVVQAVYVEENQAVKTGQVLVDVDPHDYQIAVEQARSQLAQAEAQTRAAQPSLPVIQVTNRTNISTASSDVASAQAGVAAAQGDYEAAEAKIRQAEANNAKAQADVARYRPLAEKDEVPREQFDQVLANAKAAAAIVESNQASAAASLQQVAQRKAQLADAQQHLEASRQNSPQELAIRQADVAAQRANASAARARLDQALLNLSYCKIVAPVDGVVAKRAAEVGQNVAPGQEVVLIAQTKDLWITANFGETQLQRMRPGQSARIHVDALDLDFNGTVKSMPAATGAITSVLPPENATGNFVKVVQRLPVRIHLDPNQAGLDRLRPGMSAEPKVKVL